MERRWQDGCLEKSNLISRAKKMADSIYDKFNLRNVLLYFNRNFSKKECGKRNRKVEAKFRERICLKR